MSVYYNDESRLQDANACIALGAFDGVHIAHAQLLRACAEYAGMNSLHSVAYTYINTPHPGKSEGVGGLLSTPEKKTELILMLGVDEVLMIPFDDAYSHITPEDFVKRLGAYGVRAVFCGYDYRYGAGGRGDAKLLQTMGEKYGFVTKIIPPVCMDGKPVSSSRIRQALRQGDVKQASCLLGRPYEMSIRPQHLRDGCLIATMQDQARPAAGSYMTQLRLADKTIDCEAFIDAQRIQLCVPHDMPDTLPDCMQIRFLDRKTALQGESLVLE